MGTLFNQGVRDDMIVDTSSVLYFIQEVEKVSIDTGLSIDQVLKSYEILELKRKTSVYIENGDIHDEHMAGVGELMERFITAIKDSFGVAEYNRPAFLEAIAMAIGFRSEGTIIDAICSLKKED